VRAREGTAERECTQDRRWRMATTVKWTAEQEEACRAVNQEEALETQRVWRWKRAEVERRQERETKGRFTARGTRRERRARIREEEERRRRVAERTSFWGKGG